MSNPEAIKAAVAVNLVKLRGTVGMTQLQLAEKLAYSDKGRIYPGCICVEADC